MTRRQSRRALVVVVVVGLGGIGYLLGRTLSRHEASVAPEVAAPEEGASQQIAGFRRVKVKDGKKVWELMAREARYFEDQGTVLVVEPELSFFSPDGTHGLLRGREGRVRLEHNDVTEVELTGGIRVETGDWSLETQTATYRAGANAVAAPGEVVVSSRDGSSLRGTGMVVVLADQRVALLRDVKTIILPNSETSLLPPAAAVPAPRAPNPRTS